MNHENGHNNHIDPFGDQTGIYKGVVKENTDRAWHPQEWRTPAWFREYTPLNKVDMQQQADIEKLTHLAQSIPLPIHTHYSSIEQTTPVLCSNSGTPPVMVWTEGAQVKGSCSEDYDFTIQVMSPDQLGWEMDE